jgi:hypothetical protein
MIELKVFDKILKSAKKSVGLQRKDGDISDNCNSMGQSCYRKAKSRLAAK